MEGALVSQRPNSVNYFDGESTSGDMQRHASPELPGPRTLSREYTNTSPPRTGPYLPGKPPITFKAERKPRSTQAPDLHTLSASPLPEHDFMSRHHTLIPRSRGPSAFIKRHHASHGMLDASGRTKRSSSPVTMEDLDGTTAERMGPPPAVRAAILKALATNADSQPEPYRDAKDEALQTQWKTTSVGDLERIDSMLDQLVVADSRMREALLKGPLISFETVIPVSAPSRNHMAKDSEPDTTFMTAVQGLDGEGEGEEHSSSSQDLDEACLDPFDAASEVPSSSMPLLPQLSQPARPNLLGSTGTQRIASEDIGRLRETIPVPILPKLARMYITTRQAHDRQVPPLPPPTADYLVRSRPPPSISAPSYDELCSQIMDVQRQYTCGTSKDRGISPGKPRNNMDMYISGLDGPSLDDVCALEELPVELRSRPSYVAMKKGGAKGSIKSSRNQRVAPGV